MIPKVSFIIAAFNEQDFILECVNSCLNQTHTNIEVCITDDGSTDDTFTLLSKINDPRLKIHKFAKNQGKVAAFNQSLEMASGEYISVIGADDVNLIDRIENQLKFLLDNKLDFTWGSCFHINENGDEIKHFQSIFNTNPSKVDILQDNFIPGNAMFFTRSFAQKVFPIPPELKFEDWWLAFHAVFYYRSKFLNKEVLKYRIHRNNSVGDHKSNYLLNRRKNISRHLEYHHQFSNLLTSNSKYSKINSLALSYKKLCLEDNFFKRLIKFLAIFFDIIIYLDTNKLKIKYLTIGFLGLRHVSRMKVLLSIFR